MEENMEEGQTQKGIVLNRFSLSLLLSSSFIMRARLCANEYVFIISIRQDSVVGDRR